VRRTKKLGENDNAEKGGWPGRELWGRRYGNPQSPGRLSKVVTHRAERRAAQRATKKEAGL